jgi:YidC/Oxa1 family membrane protein insertase
MQQSGPQGPSDTRNLILALVLSLAIFAGFEFFYNQPRREEMLAERARIEATQAEAPAAAAAREPELAPRETVLSATAAARVPVRSATLDGSITLEGARIDDLNLNGYRQTIEPGSPEVTLLAPINSEHGHDAFFGWELQDGENAATLADAFALWSAQEGATLTPQTPITLTLAAENGITIERTIAIDENYMFTITDHVRNAGDAAQAVRPFGAVRRQGLPEGYKVSGIVHQGLVGAFGPNQSLHESDFEAGIKHARNRARGRIGEDERILQEQGQGGWLGITDHYWLTAIVLDESEQSSIFYNANQIAGGTDFRAAYRGEWRPVPAGGEITYVQRLFAGAKRVDLLQGYENDLAIPKFDQAVDWGNFWFLTRPFFLWLLHPLGELLGNFGLGILATTIVVKLLLFPLVFHSFKSMAKMRALAPKMKELQERYAADKARQQQEILKLYQTEKVNPVSGCLPILLQIPVFFALYKTLSVTIEMRHAPFYGWIRDLSAPDPTTIFNLFGLLPYDPTTIPLIGGFMAIGVLPIMYGVSMWLLQALSPPPPDPVQAQIFALLPIIFTFMFASFPAGMVIYWTWSNTLSILQQYVIMRRQGVETQFDIFIRKRFGNKEAKPAE